MLLKRPGVEFVEGDTQWFRIVRVPEEANGQLSGKVESWHVMKSDRKLNVIHAVRNELDSTGSLLKRNCDQKGVQSGELVMHAEKCWEGITHA